MQKGFSTLEIIIALSIIATTVTAVSLVVIDAPVSLAVGSEQIQIYSSLQNTLATKKTSLPVSLTTVLLPDTVTSRSIASVAWEDTRNEAHVSSATSLSTNLPGAIAPDVCNSIVVGDWKNPQINIFSLTPGDLLPLTAAAVPHPITKLRVSGSYLVATVASAINKTDQTLFLFDISSSTRPTYVSSIDTASSTKLGSSDSTSSGSLLYLASNVNPDYATCKTGSACAQLQIVDIQNPATPVLKTNYQLPTSSPPYATGIGGQSTGHAIAYAEGRVYLGLQKTDTVRGNEFNVLDVTNPSKPLWLGGYSVGRTINRILVQGTTVFLATDDPQREFLTLDVHDPAHITQLYAYNAPGRTEYGYGRDISLYGNTVALGRTYIQNGPELTILSIASSSVTALGSDTIVTPFDPVSVQAVVLQDFLAFVLTSTHLHIFDIDDPLHLNPVRDPVILPKDTTATAMACAQNTLYVALIGNNQEGYVEVIHGL